MTKLYRASNDFIGDASLTVEQRSTLKLKSLCLSILADDPWAPGPQEDDEVEKIVLEEMVLAAIPTVRVMVIGVRVRVRVRIRVRVRVRVRVR